MPTISQLRAQHDAQLAEIERKLCLPSRDRQHARRMNKERDKAIPRRTWAEQKRAFQFESDMSDYSKALGVQHA